MTTSASLRLSLRSLTVRLGMWICLHTSAPCCFDGNYRSPAGFRLMRPALETLRSIGLLTDFPSATDFSLTLGADLPCADCLYAGNLRFSADGDLTRLFVTYTCILSSISSSSARAAPSPVDGMLPYHLYLMIQIQSFGIPLSPVTLSAHPCSTSELLRTLLRNGCF